MLSEEEERQMGVLLSNSSTPRYITDVLHMLTKCRDNVRDNNQRLAYLERLVKTILQTPESELETVSHIPDICPAIPRLITCIEPNDYATAEEQRMLYKAALESGLQLLTPIEAEIMMQGINVGTSKNKDQVLAIILMISIGQRIHQQQRTEK